MFSSRRNPKSPLVGAPAVHDWRIVLSFSCSCGQGKPMLITAADQAARCDGCGDTYMVSELHYSRNTAGRAGVQIIRIAPGSAVPTALA